MEAVHKNPKLSNRKTFVEVVHNVDAKEIRKKGRCEEEEVVPLKPLSTPKMVEGMWWLRSMKNATVEG